MTAVKYQIKGAIYHYCLHQEQFVFPFIYFYLCTKNCVQFIIQTFIIFPHCQQKRARHVPSFFGIEDRFYSFYIPSLCKKGIQEELIRWICAGVGVFYITLLLSVTEEEWHSKKCIICSYKINVFYVCLLSPYHACFTIFHNFLCWAWYHLCSVRVRARWDLFT